MLIAGFATAAEPQVAFTHVPPYGSTENLAGRVENVDCATHAVAVYIFVDGWWTKPSFAAPLSPIASDGTWTCDITTGGSDIYATQLAAYVVPRDYAPPLAEGWPQLPDELAANADALDARAVLGLFTWNDDAPYTHREIDIELSRWDNASDANNAQYVVQPWQPPGHLTRFRVPPDVTNATYSFSWRTNRIDFATYGGHVIPTSPAGGEIAA